MKRLRSKKPWSLIFALSFARIVGSEHISTSAKTGQGVIELFNTLARSNSNWLNELRDRRGASLEEVRGDEEKDQHARRAESLRLH